MRVLVTGASGTIGGAVCDALLARGDEVVGLSRDPERAAQGNSSIGWHAWSPTLERPPDAALEAVTGVINLVGEPLNQRWTEESKRKILASRETGTKNLVAAMVARPERPKVLVSQSGIGYYGDRGNAVLDESSEPGSSFDARVCVAWEAAAMEAEQGDIRVAIVRTGPVLTKHAGLLKELLLPFKLGVGGPVAGGRNQLAWISLPDEVGLLLWALDNDGATGAYNGSAPNPVTNREFSKALGRALGRPAVVPVPKLAVKVRFGAEMADAVATGSQNALPRRALEQGYQFRFPEIDAAMADALR